MGAEKLTGTPWHVEKIKKPHRDPCEFFRDEDHWCELKDKQCFSSSYCEYYQTTHKKASSSQTDNQSKNIIIGAVVQHKVYGRGIVKNIIGNKLIMDFDSASNVVVDINSGMLPTRNTKESENKEKKGKEKKVTVQQNPANKKKASVSNNSINKNYQQYKSSQSKNIPLSDDYLESICIQEDCILIHQKYGEGTVIERNGKELIVEFNEFGKKILDLEKCWNNNVIKCQFNCGANISS